MSEDSAEKAKALRQVASILFEHNIKLDDCVNYGLFNKPFPLIFGKMIDILRSLPPIVKSKKIKAGDGSYGVRHIDEIYNELNLQFAKHRIFAMPKKTITFAIEPAVDQYNKPALLTKMTKRFRFYAEDGSSVWGEGSAASLRTSGADKGPSVTQTICFRICLVNAFMIATKDLDDGEDTNEQIGVKTDTQQTKKDDKATEKDRKKEYIDSLCEKFIKYNQSQENLLRHLKTIGYDFSNIYDIDKEACSMLKEYLALLKDPTD